jgi:hypothetical protein
MAPGSELRCRADHLADQVADALRASTSLPGPAGLLEFT